ncbi:BRO-N domain-containing protein [Pseudomonas indica]|uniref:BRO-N domain-containing protein n=1 Tax=Pseudomonas indica TaxID=137658 RepID=UPI003FD58BA6
MENAFSPLTLHRYDRPLRGVMIDGQPWFAAWDFARLIGHRHPERIGRMMEDDQIRSVRFALTSGETEDVEVISESGAYRALWRYNHPENRSLRRWLTLEAVPLLRDARGTGPACPKRTLLQWGTQQIGLLEWQGVLWVPFDALPRFAAPAVERRSMRRGLLGRWGR